MHAENIEVKQLCNKFIQDSKVRILSFSQNASAIETGNVEIVDVHIYFI